jgi:hypothetical protein
MSITNNSDRPVHTRSIEISTCEYETNAVLVEGRLVDNRHCTTYYLSGEARPPGIVHDMVIRLVVRGPDPTIESVAVEMKSVPRQECLETEDSLAWLAGMQIRSGFTEQVKAAAGGAKGCSHLVALLLAMAPAAIQGAFAAMAQQPLNLDSYGGQALHFLENTCRVWRSDGPAMEDLRKKKGL